MYTLLDQTDTPFIADEAESVIAKEAAERLRSVAEAGEDVKVTFGPDIIVPLPARAVRIFHEMLEAMATRTPVSLIPHNAVLTTQQAADYLNVSRPYVVKKIDSGELPCTKVGTHRRIVFGDLVKFENKLRAQQDEALEQLNEEAERLGLE